MAIRIEEGKLNTLGFQGTPRYDGVSAIHQRIVDVLPQSKGVVAVCDYQYELRKIGYGRGRYKGKQELQLYLGESDEVQRKVVDLLGILKIVDYNDPDKIRLYQDSYSGLPHHFLQVTNPHRRSFRRNTYESLKGLFDSFSVKDHAYAYKIGEGYFSIQGGVLNEPLLALGLNAVQNFDVNTVFHDGRLEKLIFKFDVSI